MAGGVYGLAKIFKNFFARATEPRHAQRCYQCVMR